MASFDVDRVLPNTEAMRDAIVLLNDLDDETFSSVANAVLASSVNSSAESKNDAKNTQTKKKGAEGVSKQLIAHEAALRFIVYQLTYFSISKASQALEVLKEAVASATGAEDPVSLSEEKASALATLWAACGKDVVQSARTSLVKKVCNGTNNATIAVVCEKGGFSNGLTSSSALKKEPYIHCSTYVRIGEGHVLEIAPENVGEGDSAVVIKVEHEGKATDFTPQALLTLPGGATVEMTEDEAYTLFRELDAIQREMDTLFSSA